MLENIYALSRLISFLSTKFHNLTIFMVFNQKNTALVSVRDFQKNLTEPTLLNGSVYVFVYIYTG